MKSNKILLTFEDVLDTYKSRYHGIKALSLYSHWFPIQSSPTLAGIVADLMADGHLQDIPKLRLDYCSNSVEELERFEREVYDVFKIKGKIRNCTTNKYGTMNYGLNCKPLARVLKLLGVPTGAKVFKDFLIPDWILEDKENFRKFTVRLFTCESSRHVAKYPWIGIEMWKSLNNLETGKKFMNQLKQHLNLYFNIKTSNLCTYKTKCKRKDGVITKPLRFTILADSQLQFYKEIKLEDKKKQEELGKIADIRLGISHRKQIGEIKARFLSNTVDFDPLHPKYKGRTIFINNQQFSGIN